ncbi:ABC transporter ATP-binding protein [Clostridium estertheticum]|uniref:ABC transporter ATP-binding protein n=1 Tax=Clostridium estertheticum TaxID=238834 RepID=UPI001C7D62B8|nr:ABC transporter ATP-binding protein [Clostridium estertheticum]MBX4258427.1 ABC transporter ATP-binding protein [Clostridium estertheticum]WLC69618.1 ABC transporter ATP-binding protein [Clostridium estertheticum]
MRDDLAIKVENMSKIYNLYDKPIDRVREALNPFKRNYHKEHFALDNISFEIKKGETIGIIGKNGSGKSTLLKIITGVLNPTMGNIKVKGKISALLELGAGFNSEYTGLENIYLNGTMIGYSREEMDIRKEKIIEFADIGEFINQPVKTYSSGMYARLAFAVAVNVEPEILIVDEALSVGDMYFQAKCMSKMKELFTSGVTVIFVTHDTNSVKALCQKTLYLEKGKLLEYGESDEVVDMYAKKTREEMIKQNLKLSQNGSIEKIFNMDKIQVTNQDFIENSEFGERVSAFRQGTGDVLLTNLQVLNSLNESADILKFNERIKIKMYVKFIKDCTVSIGYHIRDYNNLEILGSNTLLEDLGEIKGKKDECLIVEFATKLPIIEGRYNISTVISTITIHNRAAVFADYTENAYVFSVEENSTCKIWNKVYIKNDVNLLKVKNE